MRKALLLNAKQKQALK